jgi:hypothetical protein
MPNTTEHVLLRNDDELYELIENEINKKFIFKKICKNVENEILQAIQPTELNDNYIEFDFQQNQCFYMCNDNISSIKTCKNNSIDNIMMNSRQIKKLKILKKTFVNDKQQSVVTVASSKINGIENKVIIKDFYDEYEMLYELFIANILKSDPVISQHICGYYGKKTNTSKLILEYIDGKTLNQMTNITVKDFSDIMSQIFLILNYAYNKYGFLHGDLHTDNFLIVQNKSELFDIELPLSNGKYIKYQSKYKLVFLDFGLSHLKYKFHYKKGDTLNTKNVLMLPLEEEILGFEYSIPLVDISKLLVFIMEEIIYENKHKKLSNIGISISNFIQYLYNIIGKPDKKINSTFFHNSRLEYGYIYELINENLKMSFEDLYINFVKGTRMDIHKIQDYFVDNQMSRKIINKKDTDDTSDCDILSNGDDITTIMKIIHNITHENIKVNEKIDKITEFIKELKQINKVSVTNLELDYIRLNVFHYTCNYELNKNVFSDENDMIYTVNRIYKKFENNKIIPKNMTDNEKYKVIDKIIEFKLSKFLDCFLENINIHNIFDKYNKLKNIVNQQISEIEQSVKKNNGIHINKTLKTLLIKNYNKMPYKIFQKNFIDSEINVKKFNTIEQMKFISNIVYQLKKQMRKTDIAFIKLQLDNSKTSKTKLNFSQKTQIHHVQLFFYNLYKYCEKSSISILDECKNQFIDWISYNRIILYDYYIRHISLTDISDNFIKVYFQFLELEDEIWENFYKKDDFHNMANSITFSENMLNLLVNKKLPQLIKKLEPNIPDNIYQKIGDFTLNQTDINHVVKPFKIMYHDYS